VEESLIFRSQSSTA